MSAGTHDARLSRRAAGSLAAVASALLGLTGCQSLGSLSTAASMLVEVDVYKGPLGSGKATQLGELAAIFDQAEHKLARFVSIANSLGECEYGFASEPYRGADDKADRQQLCDAAARAEIIRCKLHAFPGEPLLQDDARHWGLKKLNRAGAQILKYQAERAGDAPPAAVAASAASAAPTAPTAPTTATAPNPAPGCKADAAQTSPAETPEESLTKASETVKVAVMAASRLATDLKVEAFYWSESQIGRVTVNPRVRSLLVGYVNLASELANQISSRTVAIDKQLDLNVVGNALALSDHLKEAGPTDFLHLYEWYEATLPDPLNDWPARLSAPDRARLAKRLFSDHYWTRINQVHASGQGDVRMALIKDDIGNWNLKSFDNDAEKLLGAYRKLTLAGIHASIRVAREVGSGGTAAGLDLASQFARGRLGSTETATLSAQRIDAMRAGLTARLEKILADANSEDVEPKKAEDKARTELADRESRTRKAEEAVRTAAPAALTAMRKQLDDAKEQEAVAAARLETVQSERSEKMAVAMENAKREIEVHRRVIDSLKEFQVTAPSTPTTPRTLSNALRP